MDLDFSGIATANNLFALDLYKGLIIPKNSNQNAFLSPFSILAALSMVNVGARGTTRDEILTATKLKTAFVGDGDVNAAFKSFYGSLSAPPGSNQQVRRIGANPSSYLALANRIYIQKGFDINDSFSSVLKDYHNSTFGTVDFAGDSTATLAINKWVEGVTNGKIRNLFSKFSADTAMALASAIYFKGAWEKKFAASATKQKSFFTSKSKSVKTKFMSSLDTTSRIADFPELSSTALLKPYVGRDLHMLVILPNEKDGLADLEKKLSAEIFDPSNYNSGPIRVTLPKFKLEDKYDLKGALRKLGIQRAFESGADFSGISDESLHISQAVHKSFVEVDEKGTEAAAATGMTMSRRFRKISRIPPPPRVFNADHPFIFAIQHAVTNAVLFLGRFQKP